jgi:hypothetical protein
VISLSFERLIATEVFEEEQATVSNNQSAALTIKSRDEELLLPDSKNTKPADLRFSAKKTGFSGI